MQKTKRTMKVLASFPYPWQGELAKSVVASLMGGDRVLRHLRMVKNRDGRGFVLLAPRGSQVPLDRKVVEEGLNSQLANIRWLTVWESEAPFSLSQDIPAIADAFGVSWDKGTGIPQVIAVRSRKPAGTRYLLRLAFHPKAPEDRSSWFLGDQLIFEINQENLGRARRGERRATLSGSFFEGLLSGGYDPTDKRLPEKYRQQIVAAGSDPSDEGEKLIDEAAADALKHKLEGDDE